MKFSNFLLALLLISNFAKACPDAPVNLDFETGPLKGKYSMAYDASAGILRFNDPDGTSQNLSFDKSSKKWCVVKNAAPGSIQDRKGKIPQCFDSQEKEFYQFTDNATNKMIGQFQPQSNGKLILQDPTGQQEIVIVATKEGEFDVISKPCNNSKFSGCRSTRLNLRKKIEGSKGLDSAFVKKDPKETSKLPPIKIPNSGGSYEYAGCGTLVEKNSGDSAPTTSTGCDPSKGEKCPSFSRAR